MRNTILFCLMLLWSTVQAQVSGTAGITPAELTIEATETGGFHRITGGNEYITTPGYPELPVITQSYVLPFDAVVTGLKTTTDNRERIPGNYRVFPAQHPIPVSDTPPPPFAETIDSIYTKELYPGVAAEIVEDGYDLGYHVVTVRIYPVEYHPLSSEIYTRSVAFTINHTMGGAPADVARPATQSYRSAVLCRETITGKVQNKTDIRRFSPPVKQIEAEEINLSIDSLETWASKIAGRSADLPISVLDQISPDYIIITNNELKSTFEELAAWKTQKGVPAKIKLTEDIDREYPGADLPEKIRNYLKDIEKKYGPGKFVLLGGDVNIIPARMIYYSYSDGKEVYKVSIGSELYYSTTSGTWDPNRNGIFKDPTETLSDNDQKRTWFLGRMPVKNRQEARRLIHKIIGYEKSENVPDRNYYKNHVVAVGALSYDDGIYSANVMPYILGKYTNKDNWSSWFLNDNYDCILQNFSPICVSGMNEEMNRVNLRKVLNDSIPGVGHTHILYHMDHSNPFMLGASSIHKGQSLVVGDMDALTNSSYPQILFSGGCEPATFIKDCIGERYINALNGGGIAFIGNSAVGWADEYSRFNRFLDSLYITPTRGVWQYAIGRLFNNAAGTTGKDQYRHTLLGEPEMSVWTNTPQKLVVDISSMSISGRNNMVAVRVSGLTEGVPATICVQKQDEIYITKTITGNGQWNFTVKPRSSGIATVTVTAHNYIPVIKETPLTSVTSPFSLARITLTDDGTDSTQGDSNGMADSGETVALSIALRNHKNTALSNVTAILRSISPYIEIKDSIVGFQSSAGSDTICSIAKFRFKVNADAPEIWADQSDGKSLFEIRINKATTTYSEYFGLNINTPEIRLRDRFEIRNQQGSEILKAGDIVHFRCRLFNAGKSKAINLYAKLYSGTPSVQYIQPPIALGDIHARSETENTIPFEIKLGQDYVPGSKIQLDITVTDNYGHSWKHSFDLTETKPTPLVGEDITCKAAESSITVQWSPKTGVKGYNIYREYTENGRVEFRKLNTFEMQSAIFTDHGLDKNTMYRYKVSVVSLTGLESELSAPVVASTTFPSSGGFPVVFSMGDAFIYASMNVADVNNDGIKELMTTMTYNKKDKHGWLVALTTEGADLFDYDSNVTTHQGVAYVDKTIQVPPVIGDLDGDGRPEVITATRFLQSQEAPAQNLLICYSMFDDNNDRKPDVVWQKLIKKGCDVPPVLADVNNDGHLEIIYRSDYQSPGIQVYDYKGELLDSIPLKSAGGTISVADLDGDDDLEIIAGDLDGVSIWHHDLTPYTTNPVFTRSGYTFHSSVTVCDLDNDGEKEILVAASSKNVDTVKKETDSPVFAFKTDGSLVPGWDGSQKTRFDVAWHNKHETSVCDMDRDGRIEVACIGVDSLKVWNSDGTNRMSVKLEIPGMKIGDIAPVLADVDGDDIAEVIVATSNYQFKDILAYKLDGTMAAGFPLQTDYCSNGTPCVTDVDGDGLNEVVAGNFNMVFMWQTEGKASTKDWGGFRNNPAFTGEYEVCEPIEINTPVQWNSSQQICGNIDVTAGSLTVRNSRLTFRKKATITVRSGAHLIVDGACIERADIRIETGGALTLLNDAQIRLRPGGHLYIGEGATFTHYDGRIYPK